MAILETVLKNETICPTPAGLHNIDSGDTAWLLICTALACLMLPGMNFFYGGVSRRKNLVSSFASLVVCIGVVVVTWVFVGYSFTFGPGDEGYGNFKWGGLRQVGGLPNADYSTTVPHLAFANFHMVLCLIACSLVSFGMFEKIRFRSWVLFLVMWMIACYFSLAHWMWWGYSKTYEDGSCDYLMGWLRNIGAVDFAGGSVVHTSAGFSALAASYVVVGLKRGKYDPKTPFHISSVPTILIGFTFMWFGFLGFNGGAAISSGVSAVHAVTNTTISGASAMLFWILLDMALGRTPSIVNATLGGITGMVGMSSGAGYVLPGWAILFGVVSCFFSFIAVDFKTKFKLDDSLDVFFVHGLGGVIGTLMTSLFATLDANPLGVEGAFYERPELIGYQIVAVVISVALAIIVTTCILMFFKYTPIGLKHKQLWVEDTADAEAELKKSVNWEEAFVARLKKKVQRTTSRRVLDKSSPQPQTVPKRSIPESEINTNATTVTPTTTVPKATITANTPTPIVRPTSKTLSVDGEEPLTRKPKQTEGTFNEIELQRMAKNLPKQKEESSSSESDSESENESESESDSDDSSSDSSQSSKSTKSTN